MPAERVNGGTSLVDVLDRILDKGLVIDAWVRVSVVGLELITIEARVVVASVDTYLRYANAIGLTPLAARPPMEQGQPSLGSAQGGQNGQNGQRGGLLSGVSDALQGGGGSQGGGLLSGVTGALQGGGGNGNASGSQGGQQNSEPLPDGIADQLRAIMEQLQSLQGGSGGQSGGSQNSASGGDASQDPAGQVARTRK